jgi:EAL domain-containing protein (putative c-di-GMP-specific phosphodiesterase class I)
LSEENLQIQFEKGHTIFSEGDPGDCAYIVETGTVNLFAYINGETVKLTQFSSGDLFGEMALIDNKVRSGTAVANSDVTLLKVPRDYVDRNISQSDDLVNTLLNVVLTRFREMRTRLEQVATGKSIAETWANSSNTENKINIDTQSTTNRIQRENNLRKAFEDNQLELFYQPIISIHENKIAGCESLIRWRHPELGMISPVEFIGLAEETGLIVPIGRWIIDEACRARTRFAEIIDDIYVSVNLSPKQFESMQLVEDIEQIFDETKVQTDKIYMEITETTLMSDPIQVASILSDLKMLNTVVALDDFGTGYSSFSYLHRFPIDILKIDQSFVFTMLVNAKSQEIVRSLCSLAHSLDMKVVAEGIEQKDELSQLNSFRADYGQGYHIAKPMPEDEFVEFIRNYKASA